MLNSLVYEIYTRQVTYSQYEVISTNFFFNHKNSLLTSKTGKSVRRSIHTNECRLENHSYVVLSYCKRFYLRVVRSLHLWLTYYITQTRPGYGLLLLPVLNSKLVRVVCWTILPLYTNSTTDYGPCTATRPTMY